MFVSGLKTYTCKFLIGTKKAFRYGLAYHEVLISISRELRCNVPVTFATAHNFAE
jgi:hypothetical protein